MNIAEPVSADVDRVEFTFLSDQEIQAISVKLIENESTFDNLLNPVPGGLYDNALGSWGDAPCQTCNLNQASCPGHPGHIKLPVPVYHPLFTDQTLRLLRATCVYCSGFRLPKKNLHEYACKLRLLQHGLITEAHTVGSIGENDLGMELQVPLNLEDSEAEVEGSQKANSVIKMREKYVRQCLSGSQLRRSDMNRGKHEGSTTARREVIKEFMAEAAKRRVCASCGGISPTYRKDRSVKMFEKSLTAKEKAKMAQKKLVRKDALARKHNGAIAKHKDDESASDEGVSDSDSPSRTEEDVGNASKASKTPGKDEELDTAVSQRYISSMEVKARLVELFKKEQDIVSLLYNSRPPARNSAPVTPDMFFLTTLLVPPNRFRPEARTGESRIAEAQQNSLYKSILSKCGDIARAYTAVEKENTDMARLHQAWTELQEAVNALIDKNQNPVRGAAAIRNEEGIKQILEKKEGLFRMNMMGKRVNYAARSVISPDPNIGTNEIGVPPVFAKKLTYPEPVTSHNFRELQQAVINGVDKWPGAFAIENENGQVINLSKKSVEDRISLANQLLAPSDIKAPMTRNKKVHRHLTNGDVVLMNRQPTLHKPSIMGHRVRVLSSEKTLRMHYANCNTYNADFDGDEMNMHFPQNELARAEALQIADTDHQYLSGTAGKPLRGLIQDHISVSVALCSRDTLFNQGDYHQLIYSALRPENGHIVGERIQLIPPAVIKPVSRWTGKQVITTILNNIRPSNCGSLNMRENTQLKAEQWGTKSEEGVVLIQNGELVTGILDKSQIGPSSGGLVHAIHEAYGPAVAGRLLSCLGRLLSRYLGMRAFSCGMDDLKLTRQGESSRRRELLSANKVGHDVASSYVSIDQHKDGQDPLLLERLEEVMRDDKKQEGLDLLTNQSTRDITEAVQKACLPSGLDKAFPKNQMQTMTTSGAKGTRVNASLISCNLGQQVLEGRRVPVMVSGKTLPCFRPFETHVRAGGYIVNRFLTGIRPQEYYFHHMAGREGLIDTAVKTSRSGYLQRCIIKGMEGLTVAYDSSVRDADGSVIQFLYGEDGLDVTKQKYLYDFGFILQNVISEAAQLCYTFQLGERLGARRADFTKYMKKAIKHAQANGAGGRDPLISSVDPASNAFVTSENFYTCMINYLKDNPDGLVRDKKDSSRQASSHAMLNQKNAEMLFAMKYLRSLVEPGEAVGIVAGQSVGEPSTQMTLNTFHLAGHSAKNVTLGIPRLREILMTASQKIARPSMTLHVIEGLTDHEADAFAKSISQLRLGQILDRVDLEERVGRGKRHDLAKMYRIALKFFPSSEYCETYAITVSQVLSAIETELVPKILLLIRKEKKKLEAQMTGAQPEIGAKAGAVDMVRANTERQTQDDDDGDGDDDDSSHVGDPDGDGDATSAKQQASRNEAVSYAANDDDDDAVQQANELDEDESDGDGQGDDGQGEGLVRRRQRQGSSAITDVSVDSSDSDEDEDADSEHRMQQSQSKARRQRVLEKYSELTSFECDERDGHWCTMTLEFDSKMPKMLMLSIVQEAVRRTVVRQVAGVGTCILETNAKGERLIQASGVNLRAMQQKSDFIDTRRIQTNEIGAVLAMYGVEACRASIVVELADVFGSHGIKVDNRHLNLIADFMTRNGEFTAFNRIGLKGNVSPFTKMSFETTLAFLRDALLDGDWDDLTTPSSRLVVGKLGKVGTGGFDVLTRITTCHTASLS